jgi:hypothetical protein
MSLDVATVLKEGLDRLTTRNGAAFVGAFLLISVIGNVALDSAALAADALAAELAVEAGEQPPDALPEGAAPLGFDLPGSVIVLLSLVWILSWAATSVVTVRVLATDYTDEVPGDLLSHRLTLATVNEILARIVIWVLLTIGLLLFVLPGVFLAICFYFARPLIAIEDRNAIDAMVESWRLSKGDRFAILVLLIGAAVIYVAITLVGTVGALALAALPAAGAVLSIAVSAVANVFWLSVSARAFVQLREGLLDELAEDDHERDGPGRRDQRDERARDEGDEWDDPPGVEW